VPALRSLNITKKPIFTNQNKLHIKNKYRQITTLLITVVPLINKCTAVAYTKKIN